MYELSQEEVASWPSQANEFMFSLIHKYPDGFTADEFYELCRHAMMPPDVIKEFSGSLFREFQAAGYIEKTDKCRLSKRNGSSPLPIWKKRAEQGNREKPKKNYEEFCKLERMKNASKKQAEDESKLDI